VSNLSDLLPAGASAKQLTFTDSGSGITTKKPVVLNSDGTVTQVSGSTALDGTVSNFLSANGANTAVAYDTDSNQGLVVYRDNNAAIKGQIITIDSSNNITYGTETTIHTASNTGVTTAVYDSTHQRYVVMFKDENSYGQAVTLNPSGTGGSATFSVSAGSFFPTNSTDPIRATFLASCFDPDTGQVVVAYGAENSSPNIRNLRIAVGVVRTTPSEDVIWNTPVVMDTTGACESYSLTYDTTADRILILWTVDVPFGARSGRAVVGTISTGSPFGTLTSLGTEIQFAVNPYMTGAAYNVDNNCVGISFRNDDASNYLYTVGAKVDGSDNSVVVGTEVAVTSEYSESYTQGVTYSTAMDKFTFAYYLAAGYQYRNFNVSSAATPVTTLEAAVTFPSTSDGVYANYYDSGEDAVVFTWRRGGGPWGAQAITPASSNLSAQSFVGVADSAISASAAGSVIVQGGTVAGITLPANANTFGATVEWEADRANQTTGVYDPDNQSIVYLYIDVTNNKYPTIVEGNISGDTLTFGTPAVVTSSAASVSAIAYETTSNKFLCQYTDGGFGGDIIGKIVTLSGGTFTMGNSATIFSDGTNYGYTSCVAGGGYVGSVAILDGGTYALHANLIDISGATPTIGTEATLSGVSNNRMYRHTITYDSTASKFIIVCNDSTSNSYYSIGSVSGSDMTLTSGTQFGDSSADASTSAYYLAAIDKTFFTSSKASDGTTNLRLASLSGSTLTFGTAVNLGAPLTGTQYMGDVDYDTVNSKIVVTLPAAGGTGDANCFTMDSTGTTLTYNNDRINVGNSVFSYNSTIIYHTAAQKSVLGYDYLDSGATDFAGKSNIFNIGTVPVGSKFYVQTDGTLSTTADTPSVNAGLAISTTSLLLNGDS